MKLVIHTKISTCTIYIYILDIILSWDIEGGCLGVMYQYLQRLEPQGE